MDYDRFWSAEAKRFTTASLAGLVHRFAGVEGVVSLAGGLPPAEAFPLIELRGSTREGHEVVLGAEGQQVCEAHDLLVLEDDAYCWLHYPAGPAPPQQQPGLAGLARSMLSMDTAGRVVRIDTFSKLLGPGYRLGWITAPQPLVAKFSNWVMASTVGPCSVTQVLVSRMLQQWGMDGFTAFLQRLQALYAARAAAAHAAAVEHLGGLAEFEPVRAGMFMWVTLKGIPDVAAVLDDLVAARVVVVPGSMFATRGLQNTVRLGEPEEAAEGASLAAAAGAAASAGALSPCFRLSFAGSTPEVLAEGMRRLAEATRAVLARGGGGGGSGGGGAVEQA
ncbi:Kynurenine/alpha-aminoadipate aminotransferase, mitochondrial [Tetrabaena socialis]|uniref:Kynurenine/alpha-aminoadipate aminotransferase, mitochondrial n=1 Tax=Tetrabaena socialis TaxID=47790 RepID=A0A2J8AG08_9CHLO|nr:Kynurenine/alpha-aminoadipate aminotransferase, mitochondrial [Tetrabaena socialis]|eukprot:PNH11450.1 Kynurenine/alpha-aminoadipate aminotransferase, mitochondrial [Tetrabaena socialis]